MEGSNSGSVIVISDDEDCVGEIEKKDGEIESKDGEIKSKDGEIEKKDGEKPSEVQMVSNSSSYILIFSEHSIPAFVNAGVETLTH